MRRAGTGSVKVADGMTDGMDRMDGMADGMADGMTRMDGMDGKADGMTRMDGMDGWGRRLSHRKGTIAKPEQSY